MFQVEGNNNNLSILDYLNEDCWRVVLGYVPVMDIIRTERTSRRWQRAVLIYLKGVRFRITSIEQDNDEKKIMSIESPSNSCGLRLFRYSLGTKYYESFASWIHKLGPSVVSSYCKDLESLKTIRVKCPNLVTVTLLHMYDLPITGDALIPYTLEDFKFLKQVCFYGSYASDYSISQLIGERALDKLEFHSCYDMTGQCLNIVKTLNLKSLVFDICYSLEAQYILLAINKINQLTKLVVNDVPSEIYYEIQLVLDKMPKLEWLEINQSVSCNYSQTRTNQPSLLYFEPLCRLGALEYLSLGLNVTDNVVEAITKCCRKLKYLEFSNCEDLTSQAVEAICHNAGKCLSTLRLCDFLNDDNVVACISGCPNLACLSVSGKLLTPALPARAASARHDVRSRQRLRLIISVNQLIHEHMQDLQEYEDLILELN